MAAIASGSTPASWGETSARVFTEVTSSSARGTREAALRIPSTLRLLGRRRDPGGAGRELQSDCESAIQLRDLAGRQRADEAGELTLEHQGQEITPDRARS